MCHPDPGLSLRKKAPEVKAMIIGYLENELIYQPKTIIEHEANMFRLYTYLRTLQCQGIIGEWTVIPNTDKTSITIRFKTTFITWDEVTIFM